MSFPLAFTLSVLLCLSLSVGLSDVQSLFGDWLGNILVALVSFWLL